MANAIRVVYNDLPRLSRELQQAAAAAVSKAARDIEARAKTTAPVDTGALRNSIQTWQDDPLHAYIAPHVEYAAYVEFGTSRQRARPYMAPAAEAVRPSFLAAMERIVK